MHIFAIDNVFEDAFPRNHPGLCRCPPFGAHTSAHMLLTFRNGFILYDLSRIVKRRANAVSHLSSTSYFDTLCLDSGSFNIWPP